MLPYDHRVLVQVRDVGTANAFRVLLQKHPAEVRVDETLADRVRVFVGVGVTVMSAVISRPPSHRAFNGTATNSREENSKREGGRVRGVCPQSMIAFEDVSRAFQVRHIGYLTSCDTHPSHEIVGHGPDGRLPFQWRPHRLD